MLFTTIMQRSMKYIVLLIKNILLRIVEICLDRHLTKITLSNELKDIHVLKLLEKSQMKFYSLLIVLRTNYRRRNS